LSGLTHLVTELLLGQQQLPPITLLPCITKPLPTLPPKVFGIPPVTTNIRLKATSNQQHSPNNLTKKKKKLNWKLRLELRRRCRQFPVWSRNAGKLKLQSRRNDNLFALRHVLNTLCHINGEKLTIILDFQLIDTQIYTGFFYCDVYWIFEIKLKTIIGIIYDCHSSLYILNLSNMFFNAKYNTSTNTKIIYYFYIKNNKLLSSKVFYSETKKLKNNLDIPNTSLIKKHYMSNVLRMQKVFIEINTLLKQIRLFP